MAHCKNITKNIEPPKNGEHFRDHTGKKQILNKLQNSYTTMQNMGNMSKQSIKNMQYMPNIMRKNPDFLKNQEKRTQSPLSKNVNPHANNEYAIKKYLEKLTGDSQENILSLLSNFTDNHPDQSINTQASQHQRKSENPNEILTGDFFKNPQLVTKMNAVLPSHTGDNPNKKSSFSEENSQFTQPFATQLNQNQDKNQKNLYTLSQQYLAQLHNKNANRNSNKKSSPHQNLLNSNKNIPDFSHSELDLAKNTGHNTSAFTGSDSSSQNSSQFLQNNQNSDDNTYSQSSKTPSYHNEIAMFAQLLTKFEASLQQLQNTLPPLNRNPLTNRPSKTSTPQIVTTDYQLAQNSSFLKILFDFLLSSTDTTNFFICFK